MSPKSVEEHEYMSHISFASAVSCLMHTMVCTRPNLSQAISMVSRYMHDPEKGHREAMRWILRYIKGTVDIGLVFESDTRGKQLCMGYVDSDYAGDLDKYQSTTRYVFTLWRSTLHSTVALSTMEAEYITLTEAINRGYK